VSLAVYAQVYHRHARECDPDINGRSRAHPRAMNLT
jgi:hypothetical protein